MSFKKKIAALLMAPMILVAYSAHKVSADEMKKEEKKMDKAVQKDIVATVEADEKYSTLLSALRTAKLVETLKGPGPYTLFAPTNDAFKKLPPGTLEALLKDPPKLEKVLLYHVVSGKKMSKEVMTIKSVKTAQGTDLTIQLKDGKVLADNAQLVETDIPTANGVIHVIDTVLMPKM